jgi:hypothetical protein
MNFFKPLVSLSFWFSYYATPFSPWVSKTILVVMAVLAFAAIVLLLWKSRIKDRVSRHAAGRVAVCDLTAAVSGMLLWFVTYESVPFLSARIFWVVWLATFVTWKYFIYRRLQKDQSDERMLQDPERAAYEKYLPKPKGRK